MARHRLANAILASVYCMALLLGGADAWLGWWGGESEEPCDVVDNDYPYNFTESQKMMAYAGVAYYNPQELMSWNCRLCTSILQGFIPQGTAHSSQENQFAYVGYDPAMRQIIVAFRGTISTHWDHWFDVNFEVKLRKPDELFADAGKAHSGFLEAYGFLRHNIRNLVHAAAARHPEAKRIHVTGHSLGGALATICALDMKVNVDFFNEEDVTLHTFGSPMVGDQCFAHYFSYHVKESIRIYHLGDVVIHLPSLALGYHHVPRGVKDPTSSLLDNFNHNKYLRIDISEELRRRKKRAIKK